MSSDVGLQIEKNAFQECRWDDPFIFEMGRCGGLRNNGGDLKCQNIGTPHRNFSKYFGVVFKAAHNLIQFRSEKYVTVFFEYFSNNNFLKINISFWNWPNYRLRDFRFSQKMLEKRESFHHFV